MNERLLVITVLALCGQCSSFFFAGRGLSQSRIVSAPAEILSFRSTQPANSLSAKKYPSQLLLSAVKKEAADGEKKPKAVKKAKAEPVEGEEKKVKKTKKADSEAGEAPVKKAKVVKAVVDDKEPKAKKVKAVSAKEGKEKEGKDDFEGTDMFDLKELLGDDFLSEGEGMGMGLLPNLDEDLAKLEANLSELGDFEFDFMDDDDDEALRSIESGKFDIEEFLNGGAEEEELLSGLPDSEKKATGEPGTFSAGRTKKGEPNKKKKPLQSTLQQTMKGVEEDDDDDEQFQDDSVSDQVLEELALSLGLGSDDLLDVDFDGDDEDDKPKEGAKEGVNALEGLDGLLEKDKQAVLPLIIDGLEVDREGFELGVEPPPLEEFKRLMESLGPDSMFADDYADSLAAEEYVQPEPIPVRTYKEPPDKSKVWLPLVYEGGKSNRIVSKPEIAESLNWWLVDHEGAGPADWRVQVTSVVTNSTNVNTTALDLVNMVYDYIEAGLSAEENERVDFQILCYEKENGEPMEEHEDSIQMWLESYNTYHLVDGAAMKEAWGSIMPHIMMAEKNLQAILDQVRWALAEDSFEGALLTPRLRRLRFRGGAQEMTTGFNTEQLDSEFSVVSVR